MPWRCISCLIKHNAMYWGSGGVAQRILNLGIRWRALCPRCKSPRYPLDRRLRGPQSWSGRGGEERKSHYYPCRELNTGHRTRSLVTILTELPYGSKIYMEKPQKTFYGWTKNLICINVNFALQKEMHFSHCQNVSVINEVQTDWNNESDHHWHC